MADDDAGTRAPGTPPASEKEAAAEPPGEAPDPPTEGTPEPAPGAEAELQDEVESIRAIGEDH